jgi:hypothetical protein
MEIIIPAMTNFVNGALILSEWTIMQTRRLFLRIWPRLSPSGTAIDNLVFHQFSKKQLELKKIRIGNKNVFFS